jgi:hypothetical protein
LERDVLASPLTSPTLHGQIGILDELVLFCLPVVIAILVLAFSARRARQNEERVRTRTIGRADAQDTEETGPGE